MLLAPTDAGAALHDRLGRLAAEWERHRIHLSLSGPWPPYSFRPSMEPAGVAQSP